jgi:hypothetical protein
MCIVALNVLVPHAFNPESQYFIPLFNKISLLCRQQPGGDEASNVGATQAQEGATLRVILLYFPFPSAKQILSNSLN